MHSSTKCMRSECFCSNIRLQGFSNNRITTTINLFDKVIHFVGKLSNSCYDWISSRTHIIVTRIAFEIKVHRQVDANDIDEVDHCIEYEWYRKEIQQANKVYLQMKVHNLYYKKRKSQKWIVLVANCYVIRLTREENCYVNRWTDNGIEDGYL